MRSQYQVLVIPFRKVGTTAEFALFRREDDKNWQFIAGGGEDAETPLQAAIREAQEEGGIDPSSDFYLLKSVCSIPVKYFHAREEWPSDLLVIPEYSFAVDCNKEDIKLSDEHTDVYWGSYDEAHSTLAWDSNRTALWELSEQIKAGRLASIKANSQLRARLSA